MTSEQLRKILSVRATSRFGERIGRLIARESLLAETIDLGTDPDPRIAFRASYALEYAFAADPKRMEPHLSAFVDRYAEVSCHGAQRHFSKILALRFDKNPCGWTTGGWTGRSKSRSTG